MMRGGLSRRSAYAIARMVAKAPKRSGGKAMVLGYHGVPGARDPQSVSVANFRAHMTCLARSSTVKVVAAGRIVEWATSGDSDSLAVAITFDDGFRDFYAVAAPILQELGLTATLFVPTGMLGNSGHVSPSQLLELVASGFAVGSHSRSHVDLRRCTWRELDAELSGSRRELEDQLGTEVDMFAYPYGAHDARVRAAVTAAGYRLAFTTRRAWTTGETLPEEIPRNVISDYSAKTFGAVVAGGLHYLTVVDRLRPSKRPSAFEPPTVTYPALRFAEATVKRIDEQRTDRAFVDERL